MPETNAFWDRGYVVAQNLVDERQIAFVHAAMDASKRAGRMQFVTKIVPQGAMNEYSPIAAEALLIRCRPAIEAIAGRALAPAYARWRIYERGAELIRHVDRNACEVSASLPIFAVPDEPWPIHVRDLQGAEQGIALMPGDAVVYQGCRVQHWREPLAGERQ